MNGRLGVMPDEVKADIVAGVAAVTLTGIGIWTIGGSVGDLTGQWRALRRRRHLPASCAGGGLMSLRWSRR